MSWEVSLVGAVGIESSMVICSFFALLRPLFDCGLVVFDPAFRFDPTALLFSGVGWFCDDAGLELFAAAAA